MLSGVVNKKLFKLFTIPPTSHVNTFMFQNTEQVPSRKEHRYLKTVRKARKQSADELTGGTSITNGIKLWSNNHLFFKTTTCFSFDLLSTEFADRGSTLFKFRKGSMTKPVQGTPGTPPGKQGMVGTLSR
jgi:hypothetical protein